MGILESVTKSLTGGKDGAATQQQSSLLTSIVELLNNPQTGGIQGLIAKFKAAGLGQLIDGWVARGPNPPATASQIRQAIPVEQLQSFARQLGMDVDGATQQLADTLPQVVDNLTPDGKVPAGEMDPTAMLVELQKKLFG